MDLRRYTNVAAKLGIGLLAVAALALGVAHPLSRAAQPVSRAAQPAPANPMASLARTAAGQGPLRGVVEERLPAGSYTYLALRTDEHALRWAVTLGAGEPIGTRVSVRSLANSPSFDSPRLKRRFTNLAFGIVSRLEPTRDDNTKETPR